jgi:hypothetical protein
MISSGLLSCGRSLTARYRIAVGGGRRCRTVRVHTLPAGRARVATQPKPMARARFSSSTTCPSRRFAAHTVAALDKMPGDPLHSDFAPLHASQTSRLGGAASRYATGFPPGRRQSIRRRGSRCASAQRRHGQASVRRAHFRASSERPTRRSPTGCVLPSLGHRNQALPLGQLPGGLPRAPDGFRLLAGLALRRFFIGLATLHLAKNALALHLLFQHPESLIDIVVANEYLQMFSNLAAGTVKASARRVDRPVGINAFSDCPPIPCHGC